MTVLKSSSLPVPVFNGFVGRIPIYDRGLNLFAYDLKVCDIESLQSGNDPHVPREPSEYAVIRASEEVVLTDLVGRNCGFLDVPDSLLFHVGDLSWPKEKVVLRISGRNISRERIACIQALSSSGYRIAVEAGIQTLDHFEDIPWLSVCSFDVAETFPNARTVLSKLHKKGVKLFARNIISPDQYEQSQSLGFDLFQGRYFDQPKSAKNCFIPANKSAVLQLLARLHDPSVRIEEVENLVSRDVTLSYKILRLINTAYFGLPKRIESIRRAVVFFGLERVRNWASVILSNAVDYKPKELMTTALVRARTCEILAEKLGRPRTESYFVGGLFSMLDAIIDLPMPVIVEQLGLSDEICAALLYGTGPIGELLNSFLAIENGTCSRSLLPVIKYGFALDAYTEAIRWVNAINDVIAETPQTCETGRFRG